MKYSVLSTFVAGLCLAACTPGGQETAAGPTQEPDAPTAVDVPAPPLLNQAAANGACEVYIKALYTNSETEPTETCLAGIDENGVKMLTSHQRTLRAVSVQPGDTFEPIPDYLWHRAKFDETTRAWENPGVVFVSLSEAPLCMDVSAVANDQASDSLFVLRAGSSEPAIMNLPVDPSQAITSQFKEVVAEGGTASAFAVYAREPRVQIKSIAFRTCE